MSVPRVCVCVDVAYRLGLHTLRPLRQSRAWHSRGVCRCATMCFVGTRRHGTRGRSVMKLTFRGLRHPADAEEEGAAEEGGEDEEGEEEKEGKVEEEKEAEEDEEEEEGGEREGERRKEIEQLCQGRCQQ
eukprot:181425-Rhodomonas_salina.3